MFFFYKISWTFIVFFTYLIQQYVIIKMTWSKLKKILKLEKIKTNFCKNSFDVNNNIENSQTIRKSSIKKLSIDSTIISPTAPIVIKNKYTYLCEVIYRIIIVTITMCIGIAFKNLTDISSIVGVTSGMILAFIIPALIDTILFLPAHMENTDGKIKGRTLLFLIRNIMLCLIGLFGLIFGLLSAIKIIIEKE